MVPQSEFPDRCERLFGRERDVEYLVGRAQAKGLTAVAARPKMGKTWLLEEAGRRLAASGMLVGYHEATGQTSDLLLRAVADLYARWLADAGMWEQAKAVWQQQKEDWVGKAAKAVGGIFEAVVALAAPPYEKVAEVVREALGGLSEVNRDLRTGGVELRPLDYDQARDLVSLVARISGRRIVVILDAWEQSASMRLEHQTLTRLLARLEGWPTVHLLLGIRRTHANDPQPPEEAYQLAQDLRGASPAAEVYNLAPMRLEDDVPERDRAVSYLRQHIPVATRVADDELLGLAAGFPGAFGRWLEESERDAIETEERLRQVANDAQAYRYREFDALLPSLTGDERRFAIRLAVLPRMGKGAWAALCPIVMDNLGEQPLERLLLRRILESGEPPTFGHDTRHAAAWWWFLCRQELVAIVRREARALIFRLTANWKLTDEPDRPLAEALRALRITARQLELDNAPLALCEAANALFQDTGPETDWAVWESGHVAAFEEEPGSGALIAASLIARGLGKGRQGDAAGEIADYTAVAEMPDFPSAQRAVALVCRGVRKGVIRDADGEMADYTAVIAMSDAPPEVRAEALRNRGLCWEDRGEPDRAMTDYVAVLDTPEAPIGCRLPALLHRGLCREKKGDMEGAIADLNGVIDSPACSDVVRADALFNRAVFRETMNDSTGAIADYTRAIDTPGAPPELRTKALYNRGSARNKRGDNTEAISDFEILIAMPNAEAHHKARALLARGACRGSLGDRDGEIADCDAVLKMGFPTNGGRAGDSVRGRLERFGADVA